MDKIVLSFLTALYSKYWFKRFLESLFSIWFVWTVVFFLVRLLPGGPFDLEDTPISLEVKENLIKSYELDRSFITQYFIYFKNIITGHLGLSFVHFNKPVSEIIFSAIWVSLLLGFLSLVLSYSIGLILGLSSVFLKNLYFRSFFNFSTVFLFSAPSFLLAAILILIFSFELNWLPPALWEGPKYYILPVFCLAAKPIALISRLIFTSISEAKTEDYVRVAMSKGLPFNQVILKHVFKNSLCSVLALSAPLISGLLTGSFVVESVFAIPGLSAKLTQSVLMRDYPVILFVVVFMSSLVILLNFIFDVVYSFIDPRIQFHQ